MKRAQKCPKNPGVSKDYLADTDARTRFRFDQIRVVLLIHFLCH